GDGFGGIGNPIWPVIRQRLYVHSRDAVDLRGCVQVHQVEFDYIRLSGNALGGVNDPGVGRERHVGPVRGCLGPGS
ncbi:hypothetical protein ACHAPK_011609, partial [Fusarium culmorum]